MKNIKFYLKVIPDQILWILALMIVRFTKRQQVDSILLIPAADLNGGFGEDIMISSFISNFCKDRKVTVLTANVIRRDDFLGNNSNVTYRGGFKELNYFKILSILRDHAQVFVIGADIMDGTYGYFPTIIRLRVLRLGKLLGLDCKFSGFSVSNKMLPSIREVMLNTSVFVKVKARDIDSYDRLRRFIPEKNLVLTNDIAFICPDVPSAYLSVQFDTYKSWSENAHNNGQLIIGVCPNSIQANKIGLAKYISGLNALLDQFLANGRFSFVFLFHDLRPLCGDENDKTISKTLFDSFTKKGVDCFFPNEITNGVELKGYLSLIDFTVTGRMHLGISGAVVQKPMFGVCYANKFEGMLKLFDIDPQNSLIDYTALTNSQEIVPKFLGDRTRNEEKIRLNLPKVRAQSMLNGS